MREEAFASLAGAPLPGGRYRIEPKENCDFCTAVGAEPDPVGRAHPLYYYVATQAAMGLSVGELLALCEFDVDDGPMMVRSDARFSRELKVGVDYAVSGEIVSLVRKPSRAFGVADTLTFSLALADDEGRPCVTATSAWILPRPNLA